MVGGETSPTIPIAGTSISAIKVPGFAAASVEKTKPNVMGLGPGTPSQIGILSALRGISVEGLEFAQERGVLIFGRWCGWEVYGVKDQTGRLVEIRRLDGLNFPAWGDLGERKSHALKGSQKDWPLGVIEAKDCDYMAVAEGLPDFLAVHQYVVDEKAQWRVGPVAMLSSACLISSNLALCTNLFPARLNPGSFIALKNRQRLKSVVDRAKDLLTVDDEFFQDRQYLHLALANGVLQIDNGQFHPSEPGRPVRETLPVKYDPEAKSELFLKAFLAHILEPHDIDLLQRYLSQVLEGINHSQTILVLTGDAGWGKSSLMKIIGSLVGWGRVGIIREQLFRDEFELAHYAGKNFLFHPDMPTDFLHRKEASLFKQLCGDDPLWANVKGDDGRMVLQGNFPIILSCNGKPKIHIDSDTDAWMRRLVVLSFKTPDHEKHLGRLAETILKTEASGILNWLLEGRKKLLQARLQLPQTPEQKSRTASLLLGSESPSAFVRACLEKRKDAVMGTADLYAHYQSWCQNNHLPPFPSKMFSQIAKEEIETTLGLKYRHDLAGENGKPRRGWRGLALIEKADSENKENASELSVT